MHLQRFHIGENAQGDEKDRSKNDLQILRSLVKILTVPESYPPPEKLLR